MRIPKLACPGSVVVSERSAKSFITMAVEDSDSKKPVKHAGLPGHPKGRQGKRRDQDDAPDHQPARPEDEPPDARQGFQAELDADGEK